MQTDPISKITNEKKDKALALQFIREVYYVEFIVLYRFSQQLLAACHHYIIALIFAYKHKYIVDLKKREWMIT